MIAILVIIAVILLIGIVALFGILADQVEDQKRIRVTLVSLSDSINKLVAELLSIATKP